MSTAYVSEIFESLEGEGPCAGMATLFIRFFGCNLKCPGFNYHSDTPKTVKMFAKEASETFGLVTGGCDLRFTPGTRASRTSAER